MVSEEFKRNVESGDVVTVRSALIDYLIIDPSCRQFDEALAYAKNSMSIIEEDNGQREDVLEEEAWNEHYLNRQKVALMVNFSESRINHVKNVVRSVLRLNNRAADKSQATTESKSGGSRTGRTVLSNNDVPAKRRKQKDNKKMVNAQHEVKHRNARSHTKRESTGSRTGRRKIGEKSSDIKRSEEEVHPVDIVAWILVGGILVAAIGGITAGIGATIAKPAVLHTGLAVAGAGCFIAVSGGVIRIVRER